jgi:16S rRNA (uracil1498-N3)-methyltransferase
MTAPLFYLDSLPPAGTVVVEGRQAHHATASLRLHPGEKVLLGDGDGLLATCTVTGVGREGMRVEIDSVAEHQRPAEITVVQAIPKGDRADLAVELLTETGATRIMPWTSQRTVARWRGKEQSKRQRWQRVARAAAQQARRVYAPIVDEALSGLPPVDGRMLVLHESATECVFDAPAARGPVTIVVGPEGGLTDDEVHALTSAGAVAVHLGGLIMRTSTAGAAACVWLRGLEQRTKT